MREILTIIAAALVALLTAALAVPPFVDWTARRDDIAARIAAAVDGQAEISGAVDLRLLPAPRLVVAGLSVARPGAKLDARRATFELSPTSLMRGRLDFNEAVLEKPTLALTPGSFAATERSTRVGIAKLRVFDGALRIEGAAPLAIDHVDGAGAADTLLGPFRGEGVVRDANLSFTFSTGAVEGGRVRVKAALDDAAAAAHAEIDGEASERDGKLAFSGTVKAQGARSGALHGAPFPWRATFALKAAPGALEAADVEARFGDEDHALNFSGAGGLADGVLSGRFAARTLDLDRFRAAYGAFSTFAPPFASALKIDVAADSATLGGDAVAAPSLSVEVQPGAAPVARFDAGLPGRTRATYAGSLDVASARLDGDLTLSSRDLRGLAAWVAPAAPEIARLLAAAPVGAASLSARVRGGADAFEAQNLAVDLDRSHLTGALAWRGAREGGRASLRAQIASPALDVDALPDLVSLGAFDAQSDVTVALDAQAIKVARVGQGAANAGRIRLRAARDANGLTIEDISISDLGGATLSGSGRFVARGGGLDLKLDADRLEDFAALLRRVAPGPASEALFARAAALSPTHLTLGMTTNAQSALTQASLAGVAGGTKIDLSVQPQRNDSQRVALSLRAEAAEGALLLRQMGLQLLPLRGAGPGLIEAQGAGAIGGALATRARIEASGLKLAFEGETRLALDDARAQGGLNFEARDLGPLIQMFALGAPDPMQAIPARGKARLALDARGAELDALSVEIAGARADGRIARGGDGAYSGALAFDRLSAPFLASLVLGPAQPAPPDALWPRLKFAPSAFDPPRADLRLSAAAFDLGGGAVARDASMQARLAPDAFAFSDLKMKFGAGSIAGAGALRREGATASATTRLVFDGLALAQGPFAAQASGRLELAGAGASMHELVGALAGQGDAQIMRAEIARAAPDAIGRVIASVEGDAAPVEQRAIVRLIDGALESAPQRLAPFKAELSLAAGRVGLTGGAQAGFSTARLSGAYDLRAGRMELREALVAPPPPDWKGAPPEIEIVWRGVVDAPTRSIQAEGLVAALTERAIAREEARNAAMEADIRERAFFNRRLKFDRRLSEERAAERAEQERRERERALRERVEQERELGERERRARAEERRPPSAFAPAPPGTAPDPSTAGRY